MLVDTSPLKDFILPVTVLMIYPTMIGFKLREVLNLSQRSLMLTTMALNFLAIPVIAYLLGVGFLLKDPQLFAGLAITALLPTGNMTIAFTMLAKGNVPAAIKSTTLGLLLGSLLAPWYLLVMVGKYVPVDIWLTLKTISLVVQLLFYGVNYLLATFIGRTMFNEQDALALVFSTALRSRYLFPYIKLPFREF